ncbi:biopolymer transport transmembrane protein [Pandoraea thiooxydans]|uniref:Biopolymer transport protein ExbB n=1 Tax=Pandoraea thiooxydans TaxID=445709 RepID=A0A0G3ERF5_9BURK|nr:MotA/TolQ/ExbB proton channel family protein [Pandoraea thiooxydans]AKJ67296.1 biopolymer transporter [Pandoraea thiooxydans]APR94302.1 biopolymer transport transmembrane protein [Pandoraea thiooxydans]
MQQYGLINVWQSGDWVIRFILVFLFSMSIVSWTVTIAKGFSNRRLKRLGLAAQKRFWAARSIDGGIEALGNDANNPYRNLAIAAREASEQKDQPMLQGDRNGSEWVAYCVRNALDEQVAHLQNGLAVLASIGSTSPFVGLFGTVWGIYHALVAIGVSGQVGLDHVAGPVGEALVTTAIGLFVAIPAVLGYNYVARGNKNVAQKLMRFSYQLHVFHVTGSKSERTQPTAASSAGSADCKRVGALTA